MLVSCPSIIQAVSSPYIPLFTKVMMPALKHIYSLAAINNAWLSAKIIYYSFQIYNTTLSWWIKKADL